MDETERFEKITANEARKLRDAEIQRKRSSEEENVNDFFSDCCTKIRKNASNGYSNLSIYYHNYIALTNNALNLNIIQKTSEKLRQAGFNVREYETYLYISF